MTRVPGRTGVPRPGLPTLSRGSIDTGIDDETLATLDAVVPARQVDA